MAKKQITLRKEERVIELVGRYPTWTRRRVQSQLKREFGSGLRYENYGRLRGDILSAGAIGEYRRRRFVKLGFLPSEAKAMAGVALTSPLMQKYIRERQAMLRMSREVGMPKKAITAQIRYQYRAEGYYKGGKIQPLRRLVEWTKEKYGLSEATVVQRLGAGAARELVPRPKRQIYSWWLAAGFLRSEILEFLKAKNWRRVYYSSPGRAARLERIRWIRDLQRQGWTKAQIKAELQAYYDRETTRSPWDFIRKYKPKQKKDFKIYARAQEERAEQLQAEIGGFYRDAYKKRVRRR